MMVGSSLQTIAVLLSLKNVSGHGYTTDPPTRAFKCKEEGGNSSTGCKGIGAAIWEPHSNGNRNINGNPQKVVPTNICGAGLEAMKGLSHVPASDFKATPIKPVNGKFHFKYHCTACHKTKSWKAYITKPGWTGTEELKWDDLEEFCHLKVGGEEKGPVPPTRSEYDCPYPKRTGNKRDIILVVWERTPLESGETFLSCIDVELQDAPAGPALRTARPQKPAPKLPEPAPAPKVPEPAPAPQPAPAPAPKKQEEKEEEKDRINKVAAEIIELAQSLQN